MPYADAEKQKEYVRKWSREYYRRKKAEREKKQKKLLENFNEVVNKLTNLKKEGTKIDQSTEAISLAHTTTILSGGKPVNFDDFPLKVQQAVTHKEEKRVNEKQDAKKHKHKRYTT